MEQGPVSTEQYISCLGELWRRQVNELQAMQLRDPNPAEHPLILQFIKAKRLNKRQVDTANKKDVAINTMADGFFTWSQYVKIILSIYNVRYPSKKTLRNVALMNCLLALLYRGDSGRQLTLSCLSIAMIPSEKRTCIQTSVSETDTIPMFMVTTTNDKTNKKCKKRETAAYRHIDPRVCFVGSLALYLFARWDIKNNNGHSGRQEGGGRRAPS